MDKEGGGSACAGGENGCAFPETGSGVVGAQTKAQIETIAVLLNATPVNVLRAALASGIWGNEPVFTRAEIATLRRLVTEFPAIAAELGIEDEGPISGEIGPAPGSGGPATS